jgi:aspartyl-tRNA(Asn)/glutamyl-tRNA(Gln) amidotransferase subunit A
MESSVFSFTPSPSDHPVSDALRVAVQPNMSCCGWPADAGSNALKNYTALEDSFVIAQLKQAGAVITGTTCMSEFGFGLVTDTGSRAVAKDLADAALITDYLGEARAAAALAGLFGFKPSWGSVSRTGLAGLVPSMESWGITAQSVSEIRQVMQLICVSDDQDFSMHPEPLPDFTLSRSFQNQAPVIGVAEGYEQRLDPTEARAWETALSAMTTAGCEIRQVHLPDPAFFSLAHHIIAAVEASSSAGKYDGVRYGHRTGACVDWNQMYLKTRGESFGTLIKTFLFQGAYFQFQQYEAFEQACRARGKLMDQALTALADLDGIAGLTLPAHGEPAAVRTIEDAYDAFGFTLPANLTGLPAVQIPGLARHGSKDFGVHIMGKPFKDPDLLGLARFLETVTSKAGAA